MLLRQEFAESHLLQRKQVPADLTGYLLHIRLTLPNTRPLDVMGVYVPHDSSTEATQFRQKLFDYLKVETAASEATGRHLLMGGDWNAVQRATDRHFKAARPGTKADTEFQAHLQDIGLTSAFGYEHHRPRSFIRSRQGIEDPAASRLDDRLCTPGGTLEKAAQQIKQTQVLQDFGLHGDTDHYPVALQMHYDDVFTTRPAPMPPRRQPIKRILRPISPTACQQWAHHVAAQHALQAQRLSKDMASATPDEAAAQHADMTQRMMHLINDSMEWPSQCYPPLRRTPPPLFLPHGTA